MPLAAQDAVRYVSDEISIVMRSAPGADAPSLGSLASGAQLELLESSGGYAHVRTADGREGWVTERYLKAEPPARERAEHAQKQLADVQQELAAAKAELQKTQEERDKLLQDMARIAEGAPAAVSPELAQEAEELRARVQQLEQERAELAARSASRQKQEEQWTMLLGGALVLVGFVLAWLALPKRRW